MYLPFQWAFGKEEEKTYVLTSLSEPETPRGVLIWTYTTHNKELVKLLCHVWQMNHLWGDELS